MTPGRSDSYLGILRLLKEFEEGGFLHAPQAQEIRLLADDMEDELDRLRNLKPTPRDCPCGLIGSHQPDVYCRTGWPR